MDTGRTPTPPYDPPPEDPATEADSWIDVFEHREQRMIVEAAFVLTAINVEHQVTRHLALDKNGQPFADGRVSGPWHLYVPTNKASFAADQLGTYWRENANVSQRPRESPAVDSGLFGALGFLLVIWALPWLEGRTGYDWHGAGVMAAREVTEGEWWRTITALTLHADLGHIAGNSLFGIVFGGLLARQLGSGLGWLLIVIAAAMANTLNAFGQGEAFRSLGASTATFAALGLLAAVVWRRNYFKNTDWRRSFAPMFAAIALVAFTGIGDDNTDVAAHLFGFGCGVLVGLASANLPFAWLNRTTQWVAGGGALALIVAAWWMALGTALTG